MRTHEMGKQTRLARVQHDHFRSGIETTVLLVLAGWVHPPYRGRLLLKRVLRELSGFSFDEVSSLAEAVSCGLAGYRAAVLYYHHKSAVLTDGQIGAFRTFVGRGGGVLAVHSATASYKATPAYFEILGGRFVGHGPVGPIIVQPAEAADPIFGGIGPFTVRDELYLHELQPDIRVHFTATYQGKAEPMVWTREVGAGRVCYLCPGHRAASMRVPAVQEILRRGVHWVCGTGPFRKSS